MKRTVCAVAAACFVSACGSGSGGNPFATDTEADPSIIPETISNNLGAISYNAGAQTLEVTGIALDNSPINAVYTRKPALDRDGYEAYTTQSGSLRRHSTAYVREIDGARAAVVVTGAQFETYFGGSLYDRTQGAYDPPATTTPAAGQVTYAGSYIGLLNGPGSGEDLLAVAPGTDADPLPVQASEITGDVLVNADFADNQVGGIIYNRQADIYDFSEETPLSLEPTAIDPATGTFSGNITINLQDRGDYAGVFAGQDSSAVAGSIFAKDHLESFQNEEEYGIFVLSKCGTPNEAPICNQPVR